MRCTKYCSRLSKRYSFTIYLTILFRRSEHPYLRTCKDYHWFQIKQTVKTIFYLRGWLQIQYQSETDGNPGISSNHVITLSVRRTLKRKEYGRKVSNCFRVTRWIISTPKMKFFLLNPRKRKNLSQCMGAITCYSSCGERFIFVEIASRFPADIPNFLTHSSNYSDVIS